MIEFLKTIILFFQKQFDYTFNLIQCKTHSEHIKQLQLKIWLSKSPGERLKQFLIDNKALFNAWKKAKQNNQFNQQNNKSIAEE